MEASDGEQAPRGSAPTISQRTSQTHVTDARVRIRRKCSGTGHSHRSHGREDEDPTRQVDQHTAEVSDEAEPHPAPPTGQHSVPKPRRRLPPHNRGEDIRLHELAAKWNWRRLGVGIYDTPEGQLHLGYAANQPS